MSWASVRESQFEYLHTAITARTHTSSGERSCLRAHQPPLGVRFSLALHPLMRELCAHSLPLWNSEQDGTRDETGASDTAWARWTRMWTAEENRHGDLMNKYLWLTGRVDMRAVETTIQNLIGSVSPPGRCQPP
jgi:hypothetical protein